MMAVLLKNGYMWLGLGKPGTSRIFERAYFKDAYLVNAVRYLNEIWTVYTGGVAAAIARKWSHLTTPQGRYGAEFAELSNKRRFSKNDGPTKACITETERVADL